MSTSAPWQALKDQFLTAIFRATAPNELLWVDVWHIFLNDRWYQAQLERIARRLVLDSAAPQHWSEDVRQEAMLLLARRLKRAADLHVDAELAEEHFPGWVTTIIRHDCQDALRRLRRQQGRALELTDQTPALYDPRRVQELREEVNAILHYLAPLERRVLDLYLNGYSLDETATQLHLSYWQVQRLRQQALEWARRFRS